MAKEWVLNSATNRFQLNFKRNVGAVSEAIRMCAPSTVNEWESYYFAHVRPPEHIESLGRKLYVKISEVISAEIEEITEEDCIDYMFNLVINRTFDGYRTEITTIYGQLEQLLGVNIQPAPDKWDRLYNVDFFIEVEGRFVGLQIKPAGGVSHIPQIYKERQQQRKTHQRFAEQFGGQVFYVISMKESNKKVIQNREVVEEIQTELRRLRQLSHGEQ